MPVSSEQRHTESAAAALAGRDSAHCFDAHQRKLFVAWATGHRLAGLLWRAESHGGCPSRDDGLFDAACRQAAHSTYQELELRRVVAALAENGVAPIFLKGTALAYTVYPEPALRPRADHDMLVRGDEAAAVQALFERLGYRRELQPPGRYVASQFSVRRTDARGIRYLFDVHLKISNAWAYADALSYDAIRADAVPMPRLDPRALAPSPVHSLLLACVHRIAHHADSDDVLWLYDIYLLAGALTAREWTRALATAETAALGGVWLRGMERAASAIDRPCSEELMQRLRDLAAREQPAALLDPAGGRSRMIDVAFADWHALPDRRARLQLLAEHMLPPASYMRRVYPRCPAPLLPFAYAYRIARGAPRWFRRGGAE
jgi:hypothetical protein